MKEIEALVDKDKTDLVTNEWFFLWCGSNTTPCDSDGAGVDWVHLDSIGGHQWREAPCPLCLGGILSHIVFILFVLEYILHRQLLNFGFSLTLMHKYSHINVKYASYVFLKLEVDSVHKG